MVLERMLAPDCELGVIFDGFPRNLKQAEALDKSLAQQAKAIDKVVYIKVSEPELLKRLSGRWICHQCQAPYHTINSPPKVRGKCDKCNGELYQRPDDNVETVKKRLQVYEEKTHPLVDYYKSLNVYNQINATGSQEDVFKKISEIIDAYINKRWKGN